MGSTGIIILFNVAAAVIVAGLVFMTVRKRHSQRLREQFGPEYDRVVRREGNAGKAERVLKFRQKHREKFEIRPLSPTDRSSFRYRWNEVQSRFVENPKGAVVLAESLVTDVMQARGYPTADFDQQAADISVDHPVVVENYRAAHEIALRHGRGQASTEDLRSAMVHYRVLFQELLDDIQPQRKGA
jgi:hypothetical protein